MADNIERTHVNRNGPCGRTAKPRRWAENLVWYLLALGVGTLFLVESDGDGSQVEISYMDLVKLIEQGAPAKNPKAAIEVHETIGGKEEVARYSRPRQPQDRPHEITGTVTRQGVSSRGRAGKAKPNVAFHTAAGA